MIKVGLGLFWMGGILLAVAGIFAIKSWLFIYQSVEVDGIISGNSTFRYDISDQTRTFTERTSSTDFPVFTFTTKSQQEITVQSEILGDYQVGEKVVIRYLAKNPYQAEIYQFWRLWFWAGICAIPALIFMLIGKVTVLMFSPSLV